MLDCVHSLDHRESVHVNSPFAAGGCRYLVHDSGRAATHSKNEMTTEHEKQQTISPDRLSAHPEEGHSQRKQFELGTQQQILMEKTNKPKKAAPFSASLHQNLLTDTESNISSIRMFQGMVCSDLYQWGWIKPRLHKRQMWFSKKR